MSAIAASITEALAKEAQEKQAERARNPQTDLHHATAVVPTRGSLADRLKAKDDKSSGGGGGEGFQTKSLGTLLMVKKRLSRWRSMSRSANSNRDKFRLPVEVENTFKMMPDHRFNVPKTVVAIEQSFKFFVTNQPGYYPQKSSQICRLMSDDIKTRVKQLGFERYKFVVTVVMGQVHEQGMQVSSRCVWDASNDSSATVQFSLKDLYTVATVFAVYCE
jgi:hypothetical protein